MVFTIIVRKRAERNIAEAFNWYEMKQANLGYDFIENVEAEFNQIHSNPFLYQTRYKNIRCALTSRFPYGIFYLFDDNKIIVLTLLHLSRDPKLWKIK